MARTPLPHEVDLSRARLQNRQTRRGPQRNPGIGTSIPVGPPALTPAQALAQDREGARRPPEPNPALSLEDREKVLKSQGLDANGRPLHGDRGRSAIERQQELDARRGPESHRGALGDDLTRPAMKVAEGGVSNQAPGHVDSGLGNPQGAAGDNAAGRINPPAFPFQQPEPNPNPNPNPAIDPNAPKPVQQ